MNWYEHHIRDYDTATQHLTWDEDMAYTRLMRWYYRKEQPIPADLNEACRQVRAVGKVQRQAVEAVLNEFFILREDGWHQQTCDEVIAAYNAGEPEREQKKINEDTRLRRHRDERAALFKVLNDHGLHAPWNTKIEELRNLAASFRQPAETEPETTAAPLPATAPATPATATHGNVSPPTTHQPPPTTHHPPTANTGVVVGAAAPAPAPAAAAAATPRGSRLPSDWVLPKAWGEWALSEFPAWTADKVRTEAAKFADHWHAKTGKDASKADWLATWRNWCRSDIAQRSAIHGRQPQPTVDIDTRNAEARRLLGFAPLAPTTTIPPTTEAIDG
jgi:uncharacterized protein YdaU (DUF1376 family)